jgi:hypothetical protein
VIGIFLFRIRERFDTVDLQALDEFRGEGEYENTDGNSLPLRGGLGRALDHLQRPFPTLRREGESVTEGLVLLYLCFGGQHR